MKYLIKIQQGKTFVGYYRAKAPALLTLDRDRATQMTHETDEETNKNLRNVERIFKQVQSYTVLASVELLDGERGYCVLSLSQLLEALTIAQRPSSDGCHDVALSNCIVLEGIVKKMSPASGLQLDCRVMRRC